MSDFLILVLMNQILEISYSQWSCN